MNARILFERCPLCDSESFRPHVTGDCSRHALYQDILPAMMQWMQCAACGHVFTEGYFTKEACELIFSKTHENQKLGYDIERQRYISARMVEKILPYVDQGIWLDVGFGNGSLLFTAYEYGFTPVGIDLRAHNVSALNSLGIQSYCTDLVSLSLDSKCAVISLADVLEHMPYPKDGLQAAHRLLADHGVLLISMPNMESMVWRYLDANKQNPYWGEIEHYHNFGRTVFYKLLRETGFEVVRYGISDRYRACMEVIARKSSSPL